MNRLTKVGLAVGLGTMAFDRLIHKIPSIPAVILYAAAVVMIIGGMLASRNKSG